MSATFPGRAGTAPAPRETDVPAAPVAPALRRIAEMVYLRIYNGLGASEYDSLGLGRGSLTWAEKRQFVGKRWYQSMIDGINPPEYRIAAWNKIVTGAVLRSFNIPSPRIYGTASPANGTSCDGHPLRSSRDLAGLINRFDLARACFKLVSGWSGRGFLKVAFERDGADIRVRIAGEDGVMEMDRFWKTHIENLDGTGATLRQRQFGYLCQEVIEQHPAVTALNPSSLNTARVWMAQSAPGEWRLVGAVLRMGTGRSRVDNGVAGGIGAPIALDTGSLGRAVRRGRPGMEFREYDYHPTTHALITGTVVPFWSDMEGLCRQASAAFPYFRFMGIDVAITGSGPVVVEVEADPHQSHQAHLGRGLRSLLIELARSEWRDLH